MALTFSEKMNQLVGRRKFKIYEVTHDGSATTIDASAVGLHYIDYALVTNKTALSSQADFTYISGNAFGPFVTFANALSSSAVDVLQIWGY